MGPQPVGSLRATEKSPGPFGIQTLGPSPRSARNIPTILPRLQFLYV